MIIANKFTNLCLIPKNRDRHLTCCNVCHSEHPKGERNLYCNPARFLTAFEMTNSYLFFGGVSRKAMGQKPVIFWSYPRQPYNELTIAIK